MKRITRNERQRLPGGGLQNPGLIRIDDVNEYDAVALLGAGVRYRDHITRFEFTHSAEKSITVSG